MALHIDDYWEYLSCTRGGLRDSMRQRHCFRARPYRNTFAMSFRNQMVLDTLDHMDRRTRPLAQRTTVFITWTWFRLGLGYRLYMAIPLRRG
jgi:hypothetical protein